ncbi:MAG TPA: hypothetical protein ENJ82_00285 [Bacteroidetes bacterium]|nr:hypothetical protein [Bacteroidota bacterium]
MMQATKVLRHHGNLVILDANDILQGGKKQINPDNLSNFELHYYGGVGKMTKVCPLELVLVDEQNLRLEIERLITIIRTTYGADGMDEETMRQEILNYLVEYYGTPDQVSFDDWADQTIN